MKYKKVCQEPGKCLLGREEGVCKGPEVVSRLLCPHKKAKARVAGAEGENHS